MRFLAPRILFHTLRGSSTTTTATTSTSSTRFHITIPIFYVNSDPHIGHLYSALLADTAYRWRLLRNGHNPATASNCHSSLQGSTNYYFCVGTDEHGKKIQDSAIASGLTAKEHCDLYSAKFMKLFEHFNILNTHFVRTTSSAHSYAVQYFWRVLNKSGHIYKTNYEGWYSTADECFFTDGQVEDGVWKDGTKGKVSIETRSPVTRITEENYAFDLTKFYAQIREWMSKPNIILPSNLVHHIEAFMAEPQLGQLSISRPTSRCNWGIPVPDDPTQTIYVWLDALVNYLTVIGYPNEQLSSWPPSLQILGKDIFRFHAIYWPCFLLAAGLPLPQQLFVHGHWLMDKRKMSKSIGNVVCPFQAADQLSVDGLRYVLLSHNPFEDGNFTIEEAVRQVNACLVNDLANLLQRAINPKLNPSGEYPTGFDISHLSSDGEAAKITQLLIGQLKILPGQIIAHYDSMQIHRGLEQLVSLVQLANQFFQLQKPWKMDSTRERERINSVLFLAYETVRLSAIFLQPVTPQLSHKMLTILGIPLSERTLEMAKFNSELDENLRHSLDGKSTTEPIFPRIILKQSSA